MRPPPLRDWKADLENFIEGRGQTRADLIAIIHLCESIVEDIRPVYKFIGDQRMFAERLSAEYRGLYTFRFGEEPPAPPKEEWPEELLLDTPERRRQAVREAALALTEPGQEVTDEQVFETLKVEGKRLVAANPTATISTILNGFKTHFEKVTGRRGVFKRREPARS